MLYQLFNIIDVKNSKKVFFRLYKKTDIVYNLIFHYYQSNYR